MKDGVLVETTQLNGITYENWRTRCGKSTCSKCPHGPYWYRVFTRGDKRWHQYIGKELVAGIRAKTPWAAVPKTKDGVPIPVCGVPGRCGCGRRIQAVDVDRGRCVGCAAEITLLGENVPCPECSARLPLKRLASDSCPTCIYWPLPAPFADRSFDHNPPVSPASPAESQVSGGV